MSTEEPLFVNKSNGPPWVATDRRRPTLNPSDSMRVVLGLVFRDAI